MKPNLHYCPGHRIHDWFLPFEEELNKAGYAKCYYCGLLRKLSEHYHGPQERVA